MQGHLLLIFFSIDKVDTALEFSFKQALFKAANLYILFVPGEMIPETLSLVMAHIGFLGEKVQADVKQTIIKNYRERINQLQVDIKKQTQKKGLNVIMEIIENDFAEAYQQKIKELDLHGVIINYAQGQYLPGSFNRDEIEDFIAAPEVPVTLFLDGRKL